MPELSPSVSLNSLRAPLASTILFNKSDSDDHEPTRWASRRAGADDGVSKDVIISQWASEYLKEYLKKILLSGVLQQHRIPVATKRNDLDEASVLNVAFSLLVLNVVHNKRRGIETARSC